MCAIFFLKRYIVELVLDDKECYIKWFGKVS